MLIRINEKQPFQLPSDMYRTIITLLSYVALFSVSATSHPVPSIKVAGLVHNISNTTPRTLIINECDICDKSKRCVAEIDSVGRFEASIPFYFGHTFTVNYNHVFINAYAQPGDSIFISIDASKSPVEFHLAGDHHLINEEYSHACFDLAPIYYEVNLPPDTVPLSVYMPAFKNEIARTQAIVDRYIKEKSLQPETAELLHLDNIFTPANMAIDFKGNGIDEQTAFFTDPLFDIFNERNLKVMIFPYHLSALMNKNPEYVNTVQKSAIRDLMYAAREDGELPSRSDFFNTEYYDRLVASPSFTVDFSGLRPDHIIVMENNAVSNIDNVNPFAWLKKRFASRPVYVDVSATWCGPCRASLAASEDLRRHFKDSDIVFVIIWLKSDMESWAKLAPSVHNAIHIFIPDEDMANSIMGALNMQGFPTYFFIDRPGHLFHESVPHFNDPTLIDYLQSRQ